MTKAEWLACTDPEQMLEYLRGKASDRKLRLFGVACCRRMWNLLSNKYSRKALTIAERYADDEVSKEKLGFAWGDARRAAQVEHRQDRETADGTAMWAVALLCEADIGRALMAVGLVARCEAYPIDPSRLADTQREQSSLLRCIFGNPFRPASIASSWLTWNDATVRKIAQSIYDHRAFDRLPILADALTDAGCNNADILTHCRSDGAHVRGCWVVDLLLSRK